MVGRKRVEHFDIKALVEGVAAQPIGLRVSTNHPEGFRRVLYLFMRKNPQLPKINILQCPKSHNAFLLVKPGFSIKETSL